MKKQLYFLAALFLTMVWYGCKREDRIDHIDGNAPAPSQISNVKVTPKPGGAILTYKIPKDANLSYVKAVYEIQPGVFREAKSSYYTDTLALVGYGDTLSHEVKIFSVGKNEKESEPVSVNISALSPPVKTVFKDLRLVASFGGVKVRFQNKLKANLAIVLMVDSTGTGTWAPITTFYTGASEGSFSARGYDPEKKKFAVYLRDRWNNKSDTLVQELVPLFEELILKDKFKVLRLPTDTYQDAGNGGYRLENIFDGRLFWDGLFASSNSSKIPQWFTLDLGQKVVLSRFKEYQLGSDHFYRGSALKAFELWGSNSPDADGGWVNWELLGTFKSFKPSGLPMGQTNEEDYNYAAFNGEDFEFDNIVPAFRYIRLKSTESYSSSGQITIAELTFWGQIAE
ncbi:MAG: DUF5000 domain-containing lipoprotein [Sphingobacteriaceae bacterium]